MGRHLCCGVAVTVLATCSLVLLCLSGMSCEFLKVQAANGEMLELLDGATSRNEFIDSTTFGVYCDGDFYDLEDDMVAVIAGVFFAVSTGFNIICVCFSWMSIWCLTPTKTLWQVVSISSAIASVCSVPVFMLFEVEPCKDFRDQGQICTMSSGAYYMLGSLGCSMLVAVITQCSDPPEKNLSTWRTLSKNCWRSDVGARDRRLARRERKKREMEKANKKGRQENRKWLKLPNDDDKDGSFDKVRYDRTESEDEEACNSEDAVLQQMGNGLPKQFPVSQIPREYSFVTSDDSGVMASVDAQMYSPDFLDFHERRPLPFLDEISDVSKDKMALKEVHRNGTQSAVPPLYADMPALADESQDEVETVKTDSYDDDEDLGSLEPTVVDVTGDESVLDREGSVTPAQDYGEPQQPLLESLAGNEASNNRPRSCKKQKKKEKNASPFSYLDRPSSRNSGRRVLKGYRLLDDSSIDSSLPYLSPPLEILTLNISQEDEDLDLDYDDNENDYRTDFKEYSATTTRSEAVSLDAPPDPEPVLDFSDVDRAATPSAADFAIAPGKPIKKKKKKRSYSKQRNLYEFPSQSLASTSSLLSQTIEEETADDLRDESDEENSFDPYHSQPIRMGLSRSFSAPNLAGFRTGRLVEELDMIGINSRRNQAEVFLTGTPTRSNAQSSHGGIPRVPGSSNTVRTAKTIESPRSNTLLLFNKDRARLAVHSGPSRTSGTMNGDADDSTLPSQQSNESERARQARMRRLRRESLSPLKVRLTRSLSPVRNYEPPERLDRKERGSMPSLKPPLARSKSVPRRIPLTESQQVPIIFPPVVSQSVPTNARPIVSPLNQSDTGRIQDRHSTQWMEYNTSTVVSPVSAASSDPQHSPGRKTKRGDYFSSPRQRDRFESDFESVWERVGAAEEGFDTSFDSGGYMIDMMEVTLAELYRPEGQLKGPDEESV